MQNVNGTRHGIVFVTLGMLLSFVVTPRAVNAKTSRPNGEVEYATAFNQQESTIGWTVSSGEWGLDSGWFCSSATAETYATGAFRALLEDLPSNGYFVKARVDLTGEIEEFGEADMLAHVGLMADTHLFLITFSTYDVDDPSTVENACLQVDDQEPVCIETEHWSGTAHTLQFSVHPDGSRTSITGFMDTLAIGPVFIEEPVPTADPMLDMGSWGAQSHCVDAVAVRGL